MHILLAMNVRYTYIADMKLSAYLEKEGIRGLAFAEKIGVTHPTVYRWINGKTVPRNEHMRLLAKETNGEVTANDFMDFA